MSVFQISTLIYKNKKEPGHSVLYVGTQCYRNKAVCLPMHIQVSEIHAGFAAKEVRVYSRVASPRDMSEPLPSET